MRKTMLVTPPPPPGVSDDVTGGSDAVAAPADAAAPRRVRSPCLSGPGLHALGGLLSIP